mmetsp:Transcript_36226/g.81454  ORF Transcript_36226/g.81454 Transcript_36226/m.81454 type:complete len:383 (+) Transcript_36226:1126-2274(+)
MLECRERLRVEALMRAGLPVPLLLLPLRQPRLRHQPRQGLLRLPGLQEAPGHGRHPARHVHRQVQGRGPGRVRGRASPDVRRRGRHGRLLGPGRRRGARVRAGLRPRTGRGRRGRAGERRGRAVRRGRGRGGRDRTRRGGGRRRAVVVRRRRPVRRRGLRRRPEVLVRQRFRGDQDVRDVRLRRGPSGRAAEPMRQRAGRREAAEGLLPQELRKLLRGRGDRGSGGGGRPRGGRPEDPPAARPVHTRGRRRGIRRGVPGRHDRRPVRPVQAVGEEARDDRGRILGRTRDRQRARAERHGDHGHDGQEGGRAGSVSGCRGGGPGRSARLARACRVGARAGPSARAQHGRMRRRSFLLVPRRRQGRQDVRYVRRWGRPAGRAAE